jgi:hypothetical protein
MDFWWLRLIDTFGNVRAVWRLPRDLRERLPMSFRYTVKAPFEMHRIELLDGFEECHHTWWPTEKREFLAGDWYKFTIYNMEGFHEPGHREVV